MKKNSHWAMQSEAIAAYQKLDPVMKQLMQVASVAEPLARTSLIDLANNVGVRQANGRSLDYKELRGAIDAAIEAGLLEYLSKAKTGAVHVTALPSDYIFRQAFATGLVAKIVEQVDKKGARSSYYSFGMNQEIYIRKMRVAFYSGDVAKWNELIRSCRFRPLVLDPLCIETFAQLPASLQDEFLRNSVNQLTNLGEFRRWEVATRASELLAAMGKLSDKSLVAAVDLFAAQGNIAALEKLGAQYGSTRPQIQACAEFLKGNFDESRRYFDSAIKQQTGKSKKPNLAFPHIPQLFLALLLLRENSPTAQQQLKQVTKIISKWDDIWHLLSLPLSDANQVQTDPFNNPAPRRYRDHECSSLVLLLSGLNWGWFHSDQKFPFDLKIAQTIQECYSESGLGWLAAQMSSVIAKATNGKNLVTRHTKIAEETHQAQGSVSLIEFIRPQPAWESGLKALENLSVSVSTKSSNQQLPTSGERMIWELQVSSAGNWLFVTPLIQTMGNQGWGKGRKVALGRLYEQWQSATFAFLTYQDQAICKCLIQKIVPNYYGYRETLHEWNQDRLASALVGHPHIYWENDRDQPVQITVSQPYLTIEKTTQQIKLGIYPQCKGTQSFWITKEGSHRVSLVSFTDCQKRMADLVASLPPVPASQQQRVFAVAESLSSIIDVQSNLQGAPTTGQEVDAESGIVVQLTPYQQGLMAEVFVQPLGQKGPFCRPGVGSTSVLANVDGKVLTTQRNLKSETQHLRKVLSACQSLDTNTVSDDQTQWLFGESDNALELVMELQTLAERNQVSVLWPQGKSMEVAANASLSSFRISVKRAKDWFAASGDLKVNSELTLDLMKLLDLASISSSRFVQLDEGRFLALSKELRQRIADIAAFGVRGKGELQISPARALIVEELLQDVSFKADRHWMAHLQAIQEAQSIPVELPSTLQCELRDYQLTGYAWLKRLTHWNSGACLADDMGLGKTIQALALLVDRAFEGPSLVVAPASVGFNWENEARRFAPTLRPRLFRDVDRDQFFDDVQPGDLVIASYGLLQSEIERFGQIEWNVILLDEAQAIKNWATKRSQAVMQLQGAFKLILTGTPLENHLGELWNLFRFIVPGLLGTQEQFREQFAIPIERDNCRAARNRLKKLIQPFLLRRTKSEVLAELPPRSESILEIELSPAEIALYEALRLKALQRIEESAEEETSAGEKHLRVLAELTRLRLACCHPQLVGGDGIESTKLQQFRETIREIIEGKHKVLVFSQFVKHLEILRNELDTMGVSYQYLDGSTPVQKRKQIVEAFQSGEGDVFLISLKAGGTGLNLTAADYVIHMDPWWNPAVEDQATDRAHRIGQQRPVNVYRFITKGTIEARIVELHNTKRDLADSLLEGSDVSAKLSTEELIGLLRENQLVGV